MKQLFKKSRESLGSREMMKKLREEGFQIGRYETIVCEYLAYRGDAYKYHLELNRS